MSCTSDEIDTDLLGLGVRGGVYLQMLAFAILVSTGRHSSLPGHGEAASATLIAFLLVIMYKLGHGQIHAAEFLCVLQMLNIYSFIAFLGVAEHLSSTIRSRTGAWRLLNTSREKEMMRRGRRVLVHLPFDERNKWHLLEAMQLEINARCARRQHRSITLQLFAIFLTWVLGAWFWQTGYKGLLCDGSAPVRLAWLYLPVRAFSWSRWSSITGTYSMVVISGALVLATVLAGLRSPEDVPPSALARTRSSLKVSVRVEPVAVERQHILLRAFIKVNMPSFCCMTVLVMVLASCVECNMAYNGLQTDSINFGGLGNSGQILSLVVGFALVLSSWHAPVEPSEMWASWCGVSGKRAEEQGGRNDNATYTVVVRDVKAYADSLLCVIQGGGGDQAV